MADMQRPGVECRANASHYHFFSGVDLAGLAAGDKGQG